jgi:polar amino acid transport system permease protein
MDREFMIRESRSILPYAIEMREYFHHHPELAFEEYQTAEKIAQECGVFVSIIRGTPILVQLYLIYFGIPIALKYFNYSHGTEYNINAIPGIIFAMIALGFNQSAFDSETIRAALQSVDHGEIEAAKSLGMSGTQVLRRIIIPEAFAVALPSLGNSAINLIKATSLAFTCSVVEMTAQGKIIAGRNYRYFEIYCSLAIIYWVLTFILEKLVKYMENRIAVPVQLKERDANGKVIRTFKNRIREKAAVK